MAKTVRYGSFIVRQRVGWHYRWEYATGRYQTTRLGPGCSICGPEWTRWRHKAARWPTRRAAWRWVRRMTPREARYVEVVRVSSWAGPLADVDPFDLPRESQPLFPFMSQTQETKAS